jgi:membrane-bound lytic murein transglycosylase D
MRKLSREAGIPEEIKFLSIVESELNPIAVSRVGATGPWHFYVRYRQNSMV